MAIVRARPNAGPTDFGHPAIVAAGGPRAEERTPVTAAPLRPRPTAGDPPVLRVRDLDVDFWVNGTWYPAVIEATSTCAAGEALAIVGESGSGKSTIAVAHDGSAAEERLGARLDPARRPARSSASTPAPLRPMRGRVVSMIFQEPMTALNPVYTIGFQIAEMMRSHQAMSPKLARERAIELLELVEIPSPERRVDSYPHQLSGGQRQRAMIAQALACDPQCSSPTSRRRRSTSPCRPRSSSSSATCATASTPASS